MLAFACIHCGLTIEQFYALSFYEWSIEVQKLKVKRNRIREEWEGRAVLTRELMAVLANLQRDETKKPQPWEGKDFIKLSFDEKEEEKPATVPMTPKEMKEKFGTKFKQPENHVGTNHI